ncbi:hypothetical protein [Kaistia defluvii]|uniref:hypothetical protein n=1 Tax=Kaistia defluvii TaxID=410841 RepID=UPI0033938276
MISRMFGAPAGGTTVGGQNGFELGASKLIVPPKGSGGAGICRPSIVCVALGDPGVPVIVCAWAAAMHRLEESMKKEKNRFEIMADLSQAA